MWMLAFLVLGLAAIAGVIAAETEQHSGQREAVYAGALVTYAKSASAYITKNGEPANGVTVPLASLQLPPGTIIPASFSNIESNGNFYVWGPSQSAGEVATFVKLLGSEVVAGQVINGRIISPVGGDLAAAPSKAPNGDLIAELTPTSATAPTPATSGSTSGGGFICLTCP